MITNEALNIYVKDVLSAVHDLGHDEAEPILIAALVDIIIRDFSPGHRLDAAALVCKILLRTCVTLDDEEYEDGEDEE